MSRKNNITCNIVGLGQDMCSNKQRQVVSGDFIFKLLDTYGLPLDIIKDMLDEKNLAFDTLGFIQSALNSKNYTVKKLKAILLETKPRGISEDEFLCLIDSAINKIENVN